MVAPGYFARLFLRFLMMAATLGLAACGGGDRTADQATPTATPTPAPAPLISEPFLDLGPDATIGEVMERVTEAERSCVEEGLEAEAYEGLLEEPAFGDGAADPLDAGLDPRCLSRETAIGLIVAGVSHQAGGIGRDTVRCIEGTFTGFDPTQFTEGDREQQRSFFGALTGLLLCLTADEASRVQVGEALGQDAPPMTLQDLRCVLPRVDVEIMADFFASFQEEGPQLPPERLEQVAEAFEACGVDGP